MGKIRNLDLNFETVPIFAGQVLSGTLNFAVKDFVHVKNIVLSFEGSSKVGDSTLIGQEKWYFQLEIPLTGYLLQYGNFSGKHKVPPGDHVIPFRFPIPPYAPNSFGGKHGYVYYCAKACISVGGGPEIRTEKSIPVLGIEDLNWHPQGATSLSFHEGYSQKLLCLNLSDVSAVLQLPRSAFVPGESIKITAEISNKSKKKKVKRTTFQILQTVYYQMGLKVRESHEVVAQLNFPEIAPQGVRKLEDEPMIIPALPPSFLRGCDGINIRYDFLLIVDPGIRIQVPILIGTIPYTPDNLKNFVKHALPWKGSLANMEKPQKTENGDKMPRASAPRQKMPIYLGKVPSGVFFGPQPVPVDQRFRQNFGRGPGFVVDNNFSMHQSRMYREKTNRPVIYSPPSVDDTESLRKDVESGNFYENDREVHGVLKIEEID